MSIKKANSGDAISDHLRADTWNAFVDTANGFRSVVNVGPGATGTPREKPAATILVRNDSALQRDRGEILAIGEPLVLPSVNSRTFAQRIGFSGNVPSASDHGKFAILEEPIAPGKLGFAVIAGVVATTVEISHDWLTRADITPGFASKLTAKPNGTAEILWIESGTGTKNALVRLAARSSASVIGKTIAPVADGSTTAIVQVWRNGAATTYQIDNVYFNWMTGGQQISNGKQVVATWFDSEKIWRITGAECEA